MIGTDWLSTNSSDATSRGSQTVVETSNTTVTATGANSSITTDPPLSKGQRFFVGLGITGIAAYIIYSIYRSGSRGPPQLLWGVEPKVKENEDRLLPNVGLEKNITRPTLAMVNFPEEMRVRFERSFQPLIDSAELDLVYSSVVFYHDTTEIKPSNVEAVVREEVLAAFDYLGGDTPCAVYRSALVVDEECVNPYWSINEAFKATKGHTYFERHCIGYTVDGGRVEILFHDIRGIVNPTTVTSGDDATTTTTTTTTSTTTATVIPPTAKVDLHVSEVEDALRRCFGATTDTFAKNGEKYLETIERRTFSSSAKPIQGPYAESIDVLWLSPVPLFAMFAVALRYSRVEFDGWRLLAEPNEGIGVTPRWMLQKFRRWWYRKRDSSEDKVGMSEEEEEIQKQHQLSETFLLEIEIAQDVNMFQSSHFDTLREALGHKSEKGKKKMNNNNNNNNNNSDNDINNKNKNGISKGLEHLIITSTLPISGGRGAILRCRLIPGLTVFQAFREAWRLTALVACLNYDVRCFRLLTAVKCSPLLSSSSSSQSPPRVLLYPVSPEDVALVGPSCFSSSQYFCLLDNGSRVGAAEAFRCIREENVEKLHYLLAEYVMPELSQDE